MLKGQSRTREGAAVLRPKPKLDGDALRHRPYYGGEVNPETKPCLIHTYRHYRTVERNTKQYEYLEIPIPSQTDSNTVAPEAHYCRNWLGGIQGLASLQLMRRRAGLVTPSPGPLIDLETQAL